MSMDPAEDLVRESEQTHPFWRSIRVAAVTAAAFLAFGWWFSELRHAEPATPLDAIHRADVERTAKYHEFTDRLAAAQAPFGAWMQAESDKCKAAGKTLGFDAQAYLTCNEAPKPPGK